MTTAVLIAWMAGIVSAKCWRIAWAVRSGRPARAVLRAELAPSDLQHTPPPDRLRVPSVTETGV